MAQAYKNRRRRENTIQWQVERERFQLPDMDAPAPEPEAEIRDVVKNIFQGIDVRRQPALLEQIRETWPELAGPGAGKHARPGYLDRQTLIVFVDSAVWLNELARYEQTGILARLQKHFGAEAIKALRLQADPEDRRKQVISNQ